MAETNIANGITFEIERHSCPRLYTCTGGRPGPHGYPCVENFPLTFPKDRKPPCFEPIEPERKEGG